MNAAANLCVRQKVSKTWLAVISSLCLYRYIIFNNILLYEIIHFSITILGTSAKWLAVLEDRNIIPRMC